MKILDFGTKETPIKEIDCIIFHPENDEPGIILWLSDKREILRVFHDEAECATYTKTIREELRGENFINYQDVYFRPELLKLVEKRHTPSLGYFVKFTFRDSRIFTQQYPDEQSCDVDLLQLSEILAKQQEFRSTHHIAHTKQ